MNNRIELSPAATERRDQYPREHYPEIVGMFVTRQLMADNGIGLREAREMFIALEDEEEQASV